MAVPVDVLERVYRQDDKAFAILYEHYKLPLGSFLLSLVHNRADVDDLYQETFIRIWKQLSQPDAAVLPYFEAFLYTVARNRAYDYRRRQKLVEFSPLPEGVGESQLIAPATDNPEEQFFYRLCLEEALSMLTPRYRECLVLYHRDDFSQVEIAAQLGIQKSTVSTNLMQARIKFREYYMQVRRALHHGEATHDQRSTDSCSTWQCSRVDVEISMRYERFEMQMHITYKRFYRVVPALLPVLRPKTYLQKEVI